MHLWSLAPTVVASASMLASIVTGDDVAQFGPDGIADSYGFGNSSNTTTAPSVNPAKQLKKGLIAGGYIPFVILIVVSYFWTTYRLSLKRADS